MFLFYGLSLFLLLGGLLPSSKQKLYLLISFIILFVFSAFREVTVGTDTINYQMMFNGFEAKNDWLRSAVEPGWVFLNDLVIFFKGDFKHLTIISTIIVLVPIFIVVKKYSYNPMLSIFLYYLLYFYFYSLNITRQMMAVSIVLVAIVFLLKNNRIFFVFLVFIGALFHKSAIIVLPLLFIDKLPVQKLLVFIYITFSMLIGIFGIDHIYSLISLTGYQNYVLYYDSGNILGNFLYLLVYNSLFIFILFTIPIKNTEFKVFLIFIILLNLTVRLPFGNRLLFYLSIYQILFYPYYISFFKRSNIHSKLIACAALVFFSYAVFYRSFGAGDILPYKNVLF